MNESEKTTQKTTPKLNERRAVERRKQKGKGYRYVCAVGWVCRRECNRRRYEDLS